ncbi:MAG: SOS response-associated peptidase, partial [Thermomicrobiales bacterium]|nr:SOS response-associated peptidase [Thermomicrobiales bacterium]
GDPDGITTTAIITTPANAAAESLHDRMPLMVPRERWDEWLLGDDPGDLLHPPADDLLTWHPVDSAVGNPRNENEHLIDPLDEGDEA